MRRCPWFSVIPREPALQPGRCAISRPEHAVRQASPDGGVGVAFALADATAAFARRPIPVSPAMSAPDRFVLALAELTPAFTPRFGATPPGGTGHSGPPRRWWPSALILGVVLIAAAAALLVFTSRPVPSQCPDGSTVPAGQTCPTPQTKQCLDGSTVPINQNCPIYPRSWRPSRSPSTRFASATIRSPGLLPSDARWS